MTFKDIDIILGGSSFTYEPVSEGPQIAVCVGVYYIGEHATKYPPSEKATKQTKDGFGVKPKILFIFEVDEKITEGQFAGKNKLQKVEMALFTQGDRAKLPKFFKSWTGQDLAEAVKEAGNKFPVSDLVGRPASINIAHSEFEGKTYANIANIRALKDKEVPFTPQHTYEELEQMPIVQRRVNAQLRPDEIVDREPEE